MRKYLFSPGTMGFYLSDVNTQIPEDAFEVTEEDYQKLVTGGETRQEVELDATGKPVLGKPIETSPEQLRAIADAEKLRLLTNASVLMGPLQDAVDSEEASDAEKSSLAAWKKYRIQLNRLDVSKAPDITWPEPPK